MNRRLRVRAFTRTIPAERGYVGETRERVQQLLTYTGGWPLWEVVDEEIVPDWHLIDLGALGSSEWRSKFSGLGTWGKDGVIR